MTAIRVLLVEDVTLVRAGIRRLLEAAPGIEIVADVASAEEMFELLAERPVDVALLAIFLPGLDGIEATAELARRFPATRVIIFTYEKNERYVVDALRAGAFGYLAKDTSIEELAMAVRSVTRGGHYIGQSISRELVDRLLENARETPPHTSLTPRQREILQLIARGCSTKEIAQRLNLSAKTVDTHRTQLMARLGIHNVAGLVRYALRSGIIKLSTLAVLG